MRLDNVEELIKPTITPITKMTFFENIRLMGQPPFLDVLRVATDFEIHAPSLFETREGVPCMGFIEDPSKVRLIMLSNGTEATLEFTDYPGHVNTVSAIQIHHQVLLIVILFGSLIGSGLFGTCLANTAFS